MSHQVIKDGGCRDAENQEATEKKCFIVLGTRETEKGYFMYIKNVSEV